MSTSSRALRLITLLTIGLSVTACGGFPLECTEVGCFDGITVKVDNLAAALQTKLPATVKVCLGAACQSFTVSTDNGESLCVADTTGSDCTYTGGVFQAFAYSEAVGEEVDVSVEVKDSDGKLLLSASKSTATEEIKPNGDGCEPTCHAGEADFSAP